MTNYTPGEWEVKDNFNVVVKGTTRGICTTGGYHDGKEATRFENKANARLIAAAPDMLEALKEANKLIEIARQFFPKSMHNSDKFQLENTCAAIGKAIAKVEGKIG